ncbi:RBR-type E3 ubiquitin transferase [Entamoeba marina]
MLNPQDWDTNFCVAQKPYKITEKVEIDNQMLHLINEVQQTTELCKGECSLLCQTFRWNFNKFSDCYFDNIDKYLKASGISTSFPSSPQLPMTCDVCYEETKDVKSLSCGHFFCKKCWAEHIKQSIQRLGPECIHLKCMQRGCTCTIHYEFIGDVCPSQSERFWYFLKKNYVEQSSKAVFCPNSLCGRSISITGPLHENVNIECTCGQRFCFQCLGELHSPATCQEVTNWAELNTKDSDDSYLLLTAKRCYHCGLLTERTSGCNHMTCPKCHKDWCWMCRGDWATHGAKTGGFYSCNIYAQSEGKKLDEKAKSEEGYFRRYSHFYERYINHNGMQRQTRERKDRLVEDARKYYPIQVRCVDQVAEAVDVLVLARGWLKYSYVHAFYLDTKSPTVHLFNHQQAKIETLTDNLAEIVYSPVNKIDIDVLVTKMGVVKQALGNFK